MSLTFGCRRATSIRPAAWAAVQPIIPFEVRSSSGISGTPWSARILRANSLCSAGTRPRIWASSLSGSISSMPSYLAGITMSTP